MTKDEFKKKLDEAEADEKKTEAEESDSPSLIHISLFESLN